jgi:hypothetical protein
MEKAKIRALELYLNGARNKSEIARTVATELHIPYNDSYRKTIHNYLKKKTVSSVWEDGKSNGLVEECEKNGIDISKVADFWYKGERYSIRSKKDLNEFSYNDFRDDFIAEISKWSPKYPKINRKPTSEPHCMVFDPADIHIGKLCSSFETGEDYNSQIAVKRVMDGMHGIIQKSNGFNIDKIIFVAGNDILHTDNPRRQTTSGTPQDTDGMWYDNFTTAKRLLVDIIETLVQIADVEVVYNPSNHDYMSGFMLLDSISSWFRHSKNVTFNSDMSHRKYSVYGKCLIGTTHMDSAKVADLPMLMAHEASSNWHDCIHRYIFGHHVHHKSGKDYMSVNVETLRSPSGTDGWHHRNGYQWSPKAVEAFILSPEHGQVARLSHIF